MYGKMLLVAGAAVGYLVGTQRGRRDYEMLRRKASQVWLDPRVQKVASQAGDLAEKYVPLVGPSAADGLDAATKAARKNAGTASAAAS